VAFLAPKIGSCNQKTGPVENVGPEKLEPRERASITGLQKNREPAEQGNPKNSRKIAGCTLGYITAGFNLAGSLSYSGKRLLRMVNSAVALRK
jgi:hypothetical protein